MNFFFEKAFFLLHNQTRRVCFPMSQSVPSYLLNSLPRCDFMWFQPFLLFDNSFPAHTYFFSSFFPSAHSPFSIRLAPVIGLRLSGSTPHRPNYPPTNPFPFQLAQFLHLNKTFSSTLASKMTTNNLIDSTT